MLHHIRAIHPSYKIKLAEGQQLPFLAVPPEKYEDVFRDLMQRGVIISCVREDGKALYTDLATEVTKCLDGVVRETPDCVKCRNTRVGCELPDGTKLTAEEVCASYVVSKKQHPACKFFEHSISVGMLVTVLQTNFRDVAEKTLKEHAIRYMRDKKGAYPLGKPNPSGKIKHDYLVRLHGEKATLESDKGKPVAVDRNGNAKANGNDAPAHHCVFMGYQLVEPTSADAPAPSAAPGVASGSGSSEDDDADGDGLNRVEAALLAPSPSPSDDEFEAELAAAMDTA